MNTNTLIMLGAGYAVFMLANKSQLSIPVVKYSLADVVGYSEPCNEIINPFRFGQNPIKTEIVNSYIGPYGLRIFEIEEPSSGNWTPIYNCDLHW